MASLEDLDKPVTLDEIKAVDAAFQPMLASQLLDKTFNEVSENAKAKDDAQKERLDVCSAILESGIQLPGFPSKTHDTLLKQITKRVDHEKFLTNYKKKDILFLSFEPIVEYEVACSYAMSRKVFFFFNLLQIVVRKQFRGLGFCNCSQTAIRSDKIVRPFIFLKTLIFYGYFNQRANILYKMQENLNETEYDEFFCLCWARLE
ncbi:hypothetical protein RFI_32670 [Reticulomyxa filosa]|uniref:Uncharacterized protein n=1 Tax=Reticulomyxa filosa TaxID=46433 RepID=X6LTM1_RETFI|nr:hypothetical protein RFI_32670 [Reticulomyxa filosa]|eukprot:ETO04726.1 hypothetical protein RFI_32670 [Reticulomyxa filosa]